MWRQQAPKFMKNNHCIIAVTILLMSIHSVYAQYNHPMASKAMARLEAKKALYIVKPVPAELKEKLFTPIWKKTEQNLILLNSDSLQMNGEDYQLENPEILRQIKENLSSAPRPDNYIFDIVHEVELKDFNNSIHFIKLYYAPQRSYIGIEQSDSLMNRHIVIIDTKMDKWVKITESKSGNRHCEVQPIFRPEDQEIMDVCPLTLSSSSLMDGDTIYHYERKKCGNQIKADLSEILLPSSYANVYSSLNNFFSGIFTDINMAHKACIYGFEGKYINFADYTTSMKTKHISKKTMTISTKEFTKK